METFLGFDIWQTGLGNWSLARVVPEIFWPLFLALPLAPRRLFTFRKKLNRKCNLLVKE